MCEIKLNQKGFSLVELLVVVVIIGIIAAVAIPNLLAARRSANEGSAISSIRTLHGAQMQYQTSTGAGNYAGTVSSTGDTVGLTTLSSTQLIDNVLGGGTKSSYNFVGAITLANNSTPATFFFSANPTSYSGPTQSGTRRFCINQQGFIGNETTSLGTAFDAATTLTATPLNN
jgi:type IV pilus assembly protein PilA